MRRLRNNGVYALPGGQRNVVAVKIGDDEFFLYDRQFGTRLPPRYAVERSGKLLNWFEDYPIWTVDDLIDTEQTIERIDL